MSLEHVLKAGSPEWIELRKETVPMIAEIIRNYEAAPNIKSMHENRKRLMSKLSEKWQRGESVPQLFLNEIAGKIPYMKGANYSKLNYFISLPGPEERFGKRPEEHIPRIADTLSTLHIVETHQVIDNLRQLYPTIFHYPPQE